MRIIIFAQHYAPEEVSGAVLATELATDIVKRGHEVTFVTCAPNYPAGNVSYGYRNVFLSKEYLDGVQVVRVWSYISPNKKFWSRILNYGTFSVNALWGGLSVRKHDAIMSASPPLPLGFAAYILSRLWNVPWVLRVEDLYPDAAISAGVISNGLTIRFFYWMEKFFYRKADHISVISSSFKRNIISKGISQSKISELPVWADTDLVRPLDRKTNFRNQNDLNDKFVVMYAGNLGYTSALEEVINAAESLQKVNDIQFVIVGEGVKKRLLMEMTREKGLSNITFLPFQPRENFAEMLSSADIGLVTLNNASSNTSLPSKLFNIMASERPVLVIARQDSDITDLVKKTECGIVVPPEKSSELAQAIIEMKNDPVSSAMMGRNGRVAILNQFNRQSCIDRYEKLFISVTNRDSQ